jgi:hypothetical protein
MHKPANTLTNALTEAATKVNVGGFYTHYKSPDKTYKVIKLAVTEWDDQICVIYEAQYGDKLTFVRPLNSWLDKVEWQAKLVDRFTLKPSR